VAVNEVAPVYKEKSQKLGRAGRRTDIQADMSDKK